MKLLRLLKRRQKTPTALPAELVQAINDVGIVYRGFVEGEDGERQARPLTMSFLGSRPMFLDNQDAFARLLRRHWPDMPEHHIERAYQLLVSRMVKQREGRQALPRLSDIGRPTQARRRRGWMDAAREVPRWQ